MSPAELLAGMPDEERFLGDVCPYCAARRPEPVLSAPDQLFDRGSRRFHLLRCGACGGRYTKGSDFAGLEEYNEISYGSGYHSGPVGGRQGDRGSNPLLREFVLESLAGKPGGRVLDVGAGNGGFLNYLRGAGLEVMGVEPGREASAYCRSTYSIPCFNGTVEQFEDDRGFDAVTLTGVVEHLLNPIRTLSRVRKLLAPGGVVIFDFPLIDSLEARLAGPRWWALDLPRHTLHLTMPVARRLVSDSGLRVARSIPIRKTWFHAGFLNPPTWHGVPRKSVRGAAILGAALLFRALRLSPHHVFVCERT